MKKNPYQILSVPENADETQIRKSFRALAKKYHPDMNPDNPQAEEKFREINEAYEILSDETKRSRLDRELAEAKNSGFHENRERKTAQGGTQRQQTNGYGNMDFRKFDNMFEEFMGEPFRKEKKQPNKGAAMDFADVSKSFTDFFGFKPK